MVIKTDDMNGDRDKKSTCCDYPYITGNYHLLCVGLTHFLGGLITSYADHADYVYFNLQSLEDKPIDILKRMVDLRKGARFT